MTVTREELLDRLRRNTQVVFRPLGWPITVNKIHALQYGLITGFVLGLLAVSTSLVVATACAIVLWLLSFGVSVDNIINLVERVTSHPQTRVPESGLTTSLLEGWSLALMTIEHKPHYFWSTLCPSFFITLLFLDGLRIVSVVHSTLSGVSYYV